MSRSAVIADFLERHGWGTAAVAPLAGDASARRYLRLDRRGMPAVLMDMGAGGDPDFDAFVAAAAWLRGHGLSAPEILAAEADLGLALLEDLGPDLYARLCAAEPDREVGLYAAAVDMLARLQSLPAPGSDGGWTPPPYGAAELAREARLVVEWYLPAATGASASADLAAEFEALSARCWEPVLAAAPVAVLRDCHAENLLWLPERRGVARVGLLDFQDMLLGHPAYDLMSLLEDARRDVPEALRAAMTARFVAASGADADIFVRDAHLLAAQRNLKIVGIFARLCLRDGKAGYLGHLPRVWRHLERDLAHPALAPLAAWVARHVPAPEPGLIAQIERTAA